MLSEFGQLLSQNIWLAAAMALVAGIISSFSPCVMSTIPLVIGYVGGYASDSRKRAFKYSLLFCAGLVTTLTALGAASALLGRLMTGVGKWWYIVLGVIMLFVGLQMLGVLKIAAGPKVCKIPDGVIEDGKGEKGEKGDKRGKGLIGAFLLGILGGVLSSPCATPVLAVILAYVASRGNIVLGIILLAIYSIGHCVLILIAGTSIGFIQKLALTPSTQKVGNALKIIFSAIVVLFAFYLFYVGF